MRPPRELAALALLVTAAATGCSEDPAAPAARREDVARRGAEVMPFDLDRTTHLFDPRPDGGVQKVVADDPADRRQVALIREHLRDEARRFSRGDFGDPEAIHGHDMPGLATLRSRYEDITVELTPAPGGAVLRYRSDSPAVVDALHLWFEAQLMDHGAHARRGG